MFFIPHLSDIDSRKGNFKLEEGYVIYNVPKVGVDKCGYLGEGSLKVGYLGDSKDMMEISLSWNIFDNTKPRAEYKARVVYNDKDGKGKVDVNSVSKIKLNKSGKEKISTKSKHLDAVSDQVENILTSDDFREGFKQLIIDGKINKEELSVNVRKMLGYA